jgi:hypothetical protein
MFASASRLHQRRPLRRRSRWCGSITRIRTGTRTRARTFLERREGGHVCEAVQCRSLGLSLSSGRGLERTHTFDRSHRRTCCHQEYERIINYRYCVPIFYVIWVTTIYYATSAVGGRFSGENPYVQYYTSCIMYCSLRSCHVRRSLHQTNHAMLLQLWPKIRRSAESGPTKSHR